MDLMLERKEMFREVLDNEILAIWSGIYQEMSYIKPYGDDEVRSLWMEVPRETILDFGDFREYKRDGIVKTQKEFEQMWKDYYPKETQHTYRWQCIPKRIKISNSRIMFGTMNP